MSIFGFLKSYDQYEPLFTSYLVSQINMKQGYAQAFVTAYKKKLGSTLERGRKGLANANVGQGGHDPNVIATLQETEIQYVLSHVAYYAYINDLRVGRYRDTMVEGAVLGIILVEHQIIEMVDRAFANFIREKSTQLSPQVSQVFDDQPLITFDLLSYKSYLNTLREPNNPQPRPNKRAPAAPSRSRATLQETARINAKAKENLKKKEEEEKKQNQLLWERRQQDEERVRFERNAQIQLAREQQREQSKSEPAINETDEASADEQSGPALPFGAKSIDELTQRALAGDFSRQQLMHIRNEAQYLGLRWRDVEVFREALDRANRGVN